MTALEILPLRVLLDITPAAADPTSYTGIARVALELAKALWNQPSVALQTTAWGSLRARQYLWDQRDAFEEFQPTVRSVSPLVRALLEAEKTHPAAVIRLSVRRLLQVLNRVQSPVPRASLAAAQIIHASYGRFPDQVRRSSSPTLVTVHDITPLRLPPSSVSAEQLAITKRIVQALRPSDWVACVSEFTRRDLLAFTGRGDDRTVTIPNGVDRETFQPRNAREAEKTLAKFGLHQKPFVLTMSSLAPHKNLALLTQCWANVLRAVPDASFVIAGGRELKPSVLAAAFGVEDLPSIIFTGHVTDSEFCDLASHCEAFLFPSLYEGFGLPALEAMATGARVIAANNTSLPEVVGNAGILLDPRDAEGWGSQIVRALETPVTAAEAAAAVQRAAKFSWDRSSAAYIDLYHRMLAERRAA